MSTTLVVEDYFGAEWRTLPVDCQCGWSGDARLMRLQPAADASGYACPHCALELLLVLHPDLAQVQRAAAQGHGEAIEQLALLEEARAFLEARDAARD